MGEIGRIGPVVQRGDEEQAKTLKLCLGELAPGNRLGCSTVRFVFLARPGLVCQWLVVALLRVFLRKTKKQAEQTKIRTTFHALHFDF